jgi:hypothetical protein
MNLSDLAARLQLAAPAYDDFPAEAQYAQAVKDAVGDLADRAPLSKTISLEVVAGQAEYALPEDFLFLVALERPASGDGVVFSTDGKLVPLKFGNQLQETHDAAGLTLTLTPTPSFDHTRVLRYAAGHTLDEVDKYPALTEGLARAALLEAQSIVLAWQAQKVTQAAWSYTETEQRVDKQKQAAEYQARSEAAHARYLEAVENLKPAAGGHTILDLSDWMYLERV